MSNYTKTTNFTVKDSYVSGNPLKIVKGGELDDEFNAIQSAVATKADVASPAFTGTPTAPTPGSGDSSTKIATTGFVQDALATGTATHATNADNATNSTNAVNLITTNFSIKEVGGKLYFYYGATQIASMDSSGNLIVKNNISGFTTP
jgi:hypothetical protein